MAPLMKLVLSSLLAASASAHFLLNWPQTVGFSDDDESTAPCGGFDVDFSKNNVSDFHVNGDTIYLTGTHPTTTFLFRATLDQKAGGNWTNLLQPIQVTGLGANCEPQVPIPSGFEGQKGVIQIVADSPDGILYQCAAVNYVSGAGPAKGSNGCSNATGVTMSYTSDNNLNNLPSGSGGNSSNGTSSSGSKPSSSSSKGAAAGVVPTLPYGAVGTVTWVCLIAIATGLARLL